LLRLSYRDFNRLTRADESLRGAIQATAGQRLGDRAAE
jgi:hypothetical protein